MTTILNHEDRIRLSSWTFATAKVHTLLGFYDGDKKRVAASRKMHGADSKEVFAVHAGTCISNSPGFYERDKAIHANATIVTDGEVVEVLGRRYTLKVLPRNHDHPRNCDPIHFIPVK